MKKLKKYLCTIKFDSESLYLVEQFAKGFCAELNETTPDELKGKLAIRGFIITEEPK